MGALIAVMLILVIIFVVALCSGNQKLEEDKEEAENNHEAIGKSMEIAFANGFTASNELTGNGFKFAIAVDEARKEWLVSFPKLKNPVIFHFSDLISYEVVQNGNTVVSSNAGNAVLGGILFGTVGAVAGAASKKTVSEMCSDLHIEITVNNINVNNINDPIIKLPCISGEEICVNSPTFTERLDFAKRVVALLSYIKANAEQPKPKVSEQPEQKAIEQPKTDIYEEIEKLHDLKEKGIITEEEFTQKKKSLLGI